MIESDDEEESGEKHRLLPSCRLLLAIMVSLGLFSVFSLRINMSVAIVCMLEPPPPELLDRRLSEESSMRSNVNITSAIQDEKPPAPVTMRQQMLCNDLHVSMEQKEYQGLVLSFYFWGYIITQMPSGVLGQRLGGSRILAISVLLSGVSSILIPLLSCQESVLLLVLRFLTGFFSGAALPAAFATIAQWTPREESSIITTLAFSGGNLGYVTSLACSGYICQLLGWSYLFHIPGAFACLWAVVFLVLFSSPPASNKWLSSTEKKYLVSVIHESSSSLNSLPLLSIISSLPVWAIFIGHIFNNFCAYTYVTQLPTYLKEVHYLNIEDNGLLSALPYSLNFVIGPATGQIADLLRRKKILRTKNTRKLMSGTGCVLGFMASVFLAQQFLSSQLYIAVSLVIVGTSAVAFNLSGFMVSSLDIAPQYSGFIMSISNTLATIPGIIAPTLVGVITSDGDVGEWDTVFYMLGATYILAFIPFLVVGTDEVQPWAASAHLAPRQLVLSLNTPDQATSSPRHSTNAPEFDS